MIEATVARAETFPDLATFKPKFDQLLSARMSEIKEANIDNDSPLAGYMDYAKEMAIKGKGIRPFLTYLTYTAFGGNDTEKAMQSLLPLELFHVFSLILDDVMDKGTMRRGMKTLHVSIADKLKKENPQKKQDDLDNRGKSLAIITGKLLLQWANVLINQDPNLDEITRKKIQDNFNKMVNETAEGQAIDLKLPIYDSVPSSLIDDKNRLKTASVITRSMLMGAILANKDTPEVIKFCKDFGENLGMMYQMKDDLLDLKDPNDSDKTALSDVSENQHTHLTQHVARCGTEEQKSMLSQLQGTNPTEETRIKICRIFTESGAIQFVEDLIGKSATEARRAIDNLGIQWKKEGFYQLLDVISKRTN